MGLGYLSLQEPVGPIQLFSEKRVFAFVDRTEACPLRYMKDTIGPKCPKLVSALLNERM
jgi:hypothetical protein